MYVWSELPNIWNSVSYRGGRLSVSCTHQAASLKKLKKIDEETNNSRVLVRYLVTRTAEYQTKWMILRSNFPKRLDGLLKVCSTKCKLAWKQPKATQLHDFILFQQTDQSLHSRPESQSIMCSSLNKRGIISQSIRDGLFDLTWLDDLISYYVVSTEQKHCIKSGSNRNK